MKLGYISVELLKETEKKLSVEIAALDLHPLSEYPMHVTLMFDERECEKERCIMNPDVIYEATITGFKPLGKAIVADLYSVGLHREFKRLLEAGYQHSYDSLQLHMSVVYDPSPYDLLTIQRGLQHWVGKTIQFTNEHVRDCD